MASEGSATIPLTNAEALVFFDFLARLNQRTDFPYADPSEQRVLWDIEAVLEKQLVEPLSPNYEDLLRKARQDLRRDRST